MIILERLCWVPGVVSARQLLEPFEGNIYKFLGKLAERDYLGTMRIKQRQEEKAWEEYCGEGSG